MERPVSAHIDWIRKEIVEINRQIQNTTDALQAHKLETDVRSLKLALAHYELALKLEQEVAEARSNRNILA